MSAGDLDLAADEHLFGTSTGDWRNTAMTVGQTSDAVPYAACFREAGDALVKQGIETQMQDLIAFPALYCYRHAIELAMKNVIYEWERATSGEFSVLGTHNWPGPRPRVDTHLGLIRPDAEEGRSPDEASGTAPRMAARPPRRSSWQSN
ncbi:MAG TPA: hypothetical protein VGC32_19180, partial [Solirubrobacterales bacterium]